MKRIISAVLVLGLLAAGPLTGRARADENGKDAGAEAHHHKDKGDRAAHMEKMMKERLGLSDDQAAKLKSAWEAQKAAVKPLFEQAKESRRKLEEEVRAMASDKDIQATLDQIDANHKAMQAEHQKLEATLASVLKPYQRAKLSLLMGHMRGHHGCRGREDHKGAWGHGERGHEGHEGWGGGERGGHEGPHGRDGDHDDGE